MCSVQLSFWNLSSFYQAINVWGAQGKNTNKDTMVSILLLFSSLLAPKEHIHTKKNRRCHSCFVWEWDTNLGRYFCQCPTWRTLAIVSLSEQSLEGCCMLQIQYFISQLLGAYFSSWRDIMTRVYILLLSPGLRWEKQHLFLWPENKQLSYLIKQMFIYFHFRFI